MHVLMLVMSDVTHDARVRKEALTLAEEGHQVTVIGHHRPTTPVDLPGVQVYWTSQPGSEASSANSYPSRVDRHGTWSGQLERLPGWARRAVRWLLLPEHRARVTRLFSDRVRAIVADLPDMIDVVHAHDFNTLAVASNVAAHHGADLVYDAHECWTGRVLAGRPSPWRRHGDRRSERRLGEAAAAVLTVSDGIRQWFHDEYGWDHVTVVHNSFPRMDHDVALASPPVGMVYAGRVDAKRDLATVAAAARARPDLVLQVLTSSPPEVALPDRVQVLMDRDIDEVDEVYRRNGIALVTLTDDMLNHRLALPNKLFHAVRAGVPVVAADLPELRRVVSEHDLGTLYTPGSTASLLAALDTVTANHGRHVAAVEVARDTLTWEHDRRALAACYARLDTVRTT